MVAEPWPNETTARMQHHRSASSHADGPLTAQLQDENDEEEREQVTPEDALAELEARIGVVHAHHKVVQKSFLMRIERLGEKALEEETKSSDAAERHVRLERRVSEQQSALEEKLERIEGRRVNRSHGERR